MSESPGSAVTPGYNSNLGALKTPGKGVSKDEARRPSLQPVSRYQEKNVVCSHLLIEASVSATWPRCSPRTAKLVNSANASSLKIVQFDFSTCDVQNLVEGNVDLRGSVQYICKVGVG